MEMDQPPSPTPKKKHDSHRRVEVAVALVLLAVVGVYASIGYAHRYIPGKITFQEYAPGYLPAGVKVKEKTIEAWYIPAGDPSRYTMLNIDAGDVYIYERQKNQSFANSCPGAAENTTCTKESTPNGQQYILTTTTFDNPSQPTEQAVNWLRGDTHMLLNLSSKQKEGYSTATLGKIIDSFKPIKYNNLPYRYIDKSTI